MEWLPDEGKYIAEELEDRGIKVKPVWVNDTTRINIFFNDGDGEYKFVNSGLWWRKDISVVLDISSPKLKEFKKSLPEPDLVF